MTLSLVDKVQPSTIPQMAAIVDAVLEAISDDVIGFGDCSVSENSLFLHNITSYNYNHHDH